MRLGQRINIKRYMLFNVASVVAFSFACNGLTEILVLIGIALASIANQVMLVEAVQELTLSATTGGSKKRLVIFMIGKLVVLVSALLIGVHFVDDRIIIPLANYVAQLVALGASLKKG